MSTDTDELKARLKKLNARATQAKLELVGLNDDGECIRVDTTEMTTRNTKRKS